MKKEETTEEKGEEENLKKETFVIQSYLKSELAQMYSPNLSPAGAMNKLGIWIRHNPELHRLLYNGREGKNDITFSIRQVSLLVEYLEEP